MANVSDLIGSLYPILNLHTSTLTRHASQLRVAGFLPDEDEDLAALEAAVFLAAVTGSRAPSEVIEVARPGPSRPRPGPGRAPRGSEPKGRSAKVIKLPPAAP
jgi:hypothetical protein